jgi:pimeloyl-ACP methyl ester carboxylesterase
MITTLTNGQSIAFDQYGDSAAPALVFMHGLSGYRQTYLRVIQHLEGPISSGQIQVLNVDLRGHGESGHGPFGGYTAGTYAMDIAALIDAQLGAPVLLVGHSLGGVVAGALIAARPDLVKAAFLEDPPYFEGDAEVRNASPVAAFFPKFVAAIKELQGRSAPAAEYRPLIEAMTAPDELDARAKALTRWDPITMQAAIDGIVWSDFDPVAVVPCPLTILQADPAMGGVFKLDDGPRVLAANPHAHIVFVAGAGHSIRSGDQKHVYLEELDRFIQANAG